MVGGRAVELREARKALLLELALADAAEGGQPSPLRRPLGANLDTSQCLGNGERGLELAHVEAGEQRRAQEVHVIVDQSRNDAALGQIALHR
ncbi:MAG: hypothetical protein K2Y71_03815 [Xanthobacteraceae bacterium]|nr:hypothetical protein [Xanthobacteraceae bacterium]